MNFHDRRRKSIIFDSRLGSNLAEENSRVDRNPLSFINDPLSLHSYRTIREQGRFLDTQQRYEIVFLEFLSYYYFLD